MIWVSLGAEEGLELEYDFARWFFAWYVLERGEVHVEIFVGR
jgi:hypothetical protein